jgi:hypothetical protein
MLPMELMVELEFFHQSLEHPQQGVVAEAEEWEMVDLCNHLVVLAEARMEVLQLAQAEAVPLQI